MTDIYLHIVARTTPRRVPPPLPADTECVTDRQPSTHTAEVTRAASFTMQRPNIKGTRGGHNRGMFAAQEETRLNSALVVAAY